MEDGKLGKKKKEGNKAEKRSYREAIITVIKDNFNIG